MAVSFTRKAQRHFFLKNRFIKYIIPKNIPKGDSKTVPICALINEIYSVDRTFLTNRRDERGLHTVSNDQREEIQSLT